MCLLQLGKFSDNTIVISLNVESFEKDSVSKFVSNANVNVIAILRSHVMCTTSLMDTNYFKTFSKLAQVFYSIF